MSIIYTPAAAGGAAPSIACQSITLAGINALRSTNGLTCGRLYNITDPFANPNGYGTITVKAISNNEVDPAAVWNRTGGNKTVGGLIFAPVVPGDSIDDITVNGISLIAAPVPYNTSPAQTMADLATAINTLAVTTLVAYNTSNGFILSDTVTQTLYNGYNIIATLTGASVDHSITLDRGENAASKPVQYPCMYNVGAGLLVSIYDPIFNNTIQTTISDTVIFKFPFNFPNIRNSVFINSYFNADTFAVNNIDINNLKFTSVQFERFLYDGIFINDTVIENYYINVVDGVGAFYIINCKVLYSATSPGFASGSLNNFKFENVNTDGISYQCSGVINFNGGPGGGQVGTDIELQNSPDRFCFNANYFVQLYGNNAITYQPAAELSLGTDTNPIGLTQQLGTGFYIGIVSIAAGLPSITPDPYGKFICRPAIADTLSGQLTYVINGFIGT